MGVIMKTKKIAVFIILMMLVSSISACSGNVQGDTSGGTDSSAAKETGEGTDSLAKSWEEAENSAYTAYPETVTFTIGKEVLNLSGLEGTEYEGDDQSDNAWGRYANRILNIEAENIFEANSGDDYNQKVSMAIVSGKIPDIMTVSDYDTLLQLYENDLIEDLTDAYENAASDRIKEIYDSYEGRCLDSATIDGKLMALPTTEISHGPGILWLRKDWMEQLGLEAPEALEDIEHILQEFVDKDPGGNGEGNTIGLVVSNEVAGESGGNYMVNNIFALFGAYPQQWLDDGEGNAVYGSILPEMKEGLSVLADWYGKGFIDKEMAVRTNDDMQALLVSGTSGSFMDNWWGSWSVANSLTLDTEAEWEAYICPVDKNGYVKMYTGNPSGSYTVVRKGYEHPEVLMKLASLEYDYARYIDGDTESTKEIDAYQSLNVGGRILAMNIDYYNALPKRGAAHKKALETGDLSGLSYYDMTDYEGYKTYVDNVQKGEEIDVYGWAGYYSSVICTDMVINSKIQEIHPVFFGNTDSMPLKWPTLESMEQEMYLKIITGEETLEYFDTFVEKWKSTGGDDITAEVNQAIQDK